MSILVEDDVTWTYFTTCLSPYGKCGDLKSDTQQNVMRFGKVSKKTILNTFMFLKRCFSPVPFSGVSTFFPRTGNENVVVRIDASNSNVNQRVSMNSFCRPAKSLAQWVLRRWQLMVPTECKTIYHEKWLRNLGLWGFLDFLKKILRKSHDDSIFFSRVRKR